MELILLLQYVLSLTITAVVVFALSRLKRALLCYSHKLSSKPPSV